MTDEQIPTFVKRLNADEVEPGELASLTVHDFRKVTDYLEQRRQMYLQQYVNATFAARLGLSPHDANRGHTYSEDIILTEFGLLE